MFAKKFRLPASARMNHSSISHSPFFVIKTQKNDLGYNRYGFIAGKSIDKRSVVRNRIKRRIRSCLEKMHTELEKGYDFLFIIKKESVQKTTQELYNSIEKIIKKKDL